MGRLCYNPRPMSKLALFDLDGTMLSTQGVGMRAMTMAGSSLWGQAWHYQGVTSAGALDPHLFRAGAERCGVECSDENQSRFREAYARVLEEELRVSATNGGLKLMPGVRALLQAVHDHPQVSLGILTGNYTATTPVKLRAAGIDPTIFEVGAFGDDAATRPGLVPVAMQRYERLHGRRPEPRDVVIIGDTPKDVEAAATNGCLSLGVATGPYSVEDLKQAGATAAVKDLSNPLPFWELLGVEPR